MAENAYLRLTGETQGEIEGSETRRREGSIMVFAVNHEVTNITDSATGIHTGNRQHKPLIVTKEIDRATPLLWQALVTSENILKFDLRFFQLDSAGKEVQFYTVQLENARIVDIRFEMLNNKYTENEQHKEREHVSFTYQRITWTFEDGGITAVDDWNAPIY